MASDADAYALLERATAGLCAPFALVDLDALRANATEMERRAVPKPIRLASKSLRCRSLQERVLARDGFSGTLAFTLAEAVWLASQGVEDLLVAYPSTDVDSLRALAAAPAQDGPRVKPLCELVTVMVDCVEQLELIGRACGAGTPESARVRVCIDVDTSWWALGGRVRVGARRSPLHTPEQVAKLATQILRSKHLRLVGLMAYEAQIAGVGDAPPSRPLRARAIQAMQSRSARELAHRRAAIVAAVREAIVFAGASPLEFVNGGGTGSLERTASEPSVTEVAAGSGLYGPTLFDAYRAFKPKPAALFALPVVRRPGRDVVTVLGGGYLASGPADAARLPRPHLPAGLRLDRQEGAGEVQTPLLGQGASACTSATRRQGSCVSASTASICSRAGRSSSRCQHIGVRDSASYEPACAGKCFPMSLNGNTVDRQAPHEELLREVVETLAAIDRPPCSPGEREAAQWLAGRLGAIDGVEVALEDEPSWGTFPPTSTGLGLLGIMGALLTLSGRRRLGALLAAGTLAGIVDEAQNGPRIVRRIVRRRRSTVNVVACVDARDGDGGLERGATVDTLVVHAHHDAAQTGLIFDQTLQRKVYELRPQLIERGKTSLPQWWIGLAGPLGTIVGAATRRRAPVKAALAIGAIGTAFVADIWRSETVPGANDNLSAVAVLVALAERLQAEPLPGLRVLLVSCGAEETLQDGIRAFIERHRDELEPQRTCFVNLDTVGSPHLAMVEGEGPIWMEEYEGPWLRDRVVECARRLEIPLERGFRARASTDGVIPSRAGYPLATLVSINEWRSLSNYHLPSDVPSNLDYGTVADTARLVYELARTLAR